MERKKSNSANLEKGKPISFMMGLIVALAILFTAFEWGAKDIKVETSHAVNLLEDDLEDIMITRPEPPEPPKPEPVKEPDILIEVPDEEKVESIEIAPSEDIASMPIPAPIPSGEDEKEEEADDIVHFSVEIMPEFPGGEKALLKWIAEHVSYPTSAAERNIEGRVSCAFVINTDGSISDIQILRSVDPSLDREAIRVLKEMPNWKPGMQQGRAVRVKYNVPVRFKLQK